MLHIVISTNRKVWLYLRQGDTRTALKHSPSLALCCQIILPELCVAFLGSFQDTLKNGVSQNRDRTAFLQIALVIEKIIGSSAKALDFHVFHVQWKGHRAQVSFILHLDKPIYSRQIKKIQVRLSFFLLKSQLSF